MGTYANQQTVTTEFVEVELKDSLLTADEEAFLLGLQRDDDVPQAVENR